MAVPSGALHGIVSIARRGSFFLSSALFSMLALASGASRAQEEGRPLSEAVQLHGGRCLEAPSFHAAVGAWLGRSRIDRRVTVEVDELADGVEVRVRRDGGLVGERRMELGGRPCDEVRAAVALGVASALDATLLDDLGVARPAAPVESSAKPVLPPSPPTPRTLPQTRPPRAVGVRMMVEETVLLNVLPRVVLGAAPAVDVTPLRGLDVRVGALFGGGGGIPIGDGAASATLLVGRADLCGGGALAGGRVHLRGCGGFLIGSALAEGRSFAVVRSSAVPWVAPAIRADVRWTLNRTIGLLFSAEGLFPLIRPELQELDTNGDVVSQRPFPIAGAALGVGPVIDF